MGSVCKKFKEAWLTTSIDSSTASDGRRFYDELEEALILADVGVDTAADAVAQLRKRVQREAA